MFFLSHPNPISPFIPTTFFLLPPVTIQNLHLTNFQHLISQPEKSHLDSPMN
ncbi:hypothetical protein Lalb_Chr14g0369281 [Lupinus albus]|uniref:Uncharacterized protein n=1 Tax=Lupinus albus TaxID=3870 RepID=A0A6A4PCA6_LUPAL|nr:hypothetical protein Lalb_Chr14g0369281 [Lupinus albus]